MYAATLRIENRKNAPLIRKRQVADDRCRRWFMTAAAVDDQPPARKKSNADARAISAPQMQRIAFDIEGPIMEPAQAGGYCKRELRAGTEPGMGRNDLRNVHSMPAVERQQLLHRLQVLPHTIAFW